MDDLDKFPPIEIELGKERTNKVLMLPLPIRDEFLEYMNLHFLRLNGEVKPEYLKMGALVAAVRETCGDEIFREIAESAHFVTIEFIESLAEPVLAAAV